jgi:hypothetical protein
MEERKSSWGCYFVLEGVEAIKIGAHFEELGDRTGPCPDEVFEL